MIHDLFDSSKMYASQRIYTTLYIQTFIYILFENLENVELKTHYPAIGTKSL
jgi:hypothetical protein